MRIVNRATFLEIPGCTLASKYSPYSFGPLMISGGRSGENDFICVDVADAIKHSSSDEFIDVLDHALQSGDQMKMDFDYFGRDGLYDNDQMFAVWDQEDIIGLLRVLLGILAPTKEEVSTILTTIGERDKLSLNTLLLVRNSILQVAKNEPREATTLGMTLAFTELRDQLFDCGE